MVNNNLDPHQQVQEQEYLFPYHWTYAPASESGRSYFCYLERVVELIPKDAQKLLDVGSGDGRAAAYLKDGRPGLEVTGSDYSDRALALAGLMSVPRMMKWEKLDIVEPVTVGEVFDVITAVEVLEHIQPEKLSTVISNIGRLLKQGGVFIITVPSIRAFRPKKHHQHFTEQTLKNILAGSGFRVEVCEGQEKTDSFFFFLYKLADNRWWTLKPLMRWMNLVAYRRWVDRCPTKRANRLIMKAVKA